MKKQQAPLRLRVSRAGGKHIELMYSLTAEALAEAGVVKLQRIAKQYEPYVEPPQPVFEEDSYFADKFCFDDEEKETLDVLFAGLSH